MVEHAALSVVSRGPASTRRPWSWIGKLSHGNVSEFTISIGFHHIANCLVAFLRLGLNCQLVPFYFWVDFIGITLLQIISTRQALLH